MKTVIAHAQSGNNHAVAAQLRVLIVPAEEGGYVAQGLEIDYLATGDTVEEVRDNFAQGLLRTVEAYVRRGRSMTALFAKGKTPPEAWQLWLDGDGKDVLTCGTVVDLDLPDGAPFFSSLAFREAKTSHHA